MKQSFLEISFAAIAFTLAFSIAYATGLDIVKDAILYAFIIQWVLYIPAYLFQTEKFYDLSGSITYIFVISYVLYSTCLLYTSPSPRDGLLSRMPSSA